MGSLFLCVIRLLLLLPFQRIQIILLLVDVVRNSCADPGVWIVVLVVVPYGPPLSKARDRRVRATDLSS